MTFHIVRMNEKIEQIALNYQLEIDEIKEENKYIKDWNHLIPGTKLRLPEISDAINEELDDEEPFIEEYYPKLKMDTFVQEEKTDKEQPLEQVEEKKKPNIVKQELILPSDNPVYPYQNYYYTYPYYMYYNRNINRYSKIK